MKRVALLAIAMALASCTHRPPAPSAPALPAESQAAEPGTPPAAPPPSPPAPPAELPPPARPPQTERGQWCVVAVSERTAEQTKPWLRKLSDAGFKTDVQPARVANTTWYRVLLPGYRAEGEARAAVPLVNQVAGIGDAFVWRCKAPAVAAPASPSPPPPPRAPSAS